jgi:hypothetical protein
MRVKIQNKKIVTHDGTLGGLRTLVERAELIMPDSATVYQRANNVIEFLWSSDDNIQRSDTEE